MGSFKSFDLSLAITAVAEGKWSIAIDHLQDLRLDRLDDRDPEELQLKQQALELVFQVLSQGDFEQQWQIAKIVPKLGKIAVQPLLDIVNDSEVDLEDRWVVARILGEFPDPDAIAALVELICQAEDPELTAIATNALTKIGTPAIAAITALLSTPDRATAVSILGQIRHSQTIEPLLTVAEDLDPQIRTLAIEALGCFHDGRIPPLLLTKLTDPAASVRKAAAISLSLRSDLAAELDLLTHLKPLLFDLNLDVCAATALGLARLPDPQVVAVLTTVLASSRTPDRLKSAIVLALGWIGTCEAIDSLIAALPDSSPDLAIEIVRSIGKTEWERVYASRALVDYLSSDRYVAAEIPAIVSQEIAAELGNLGDRDSVSALIRLLGDPDDRVKLYAIAAISKLCSEIPPEIWQLVDREGNFRPQAADLNPELQLGIRMFLADWHQTNSC
jgi:HEAT repeat protein